MKKLFYILQAMTIFGLAAIAADELGITQGWQYSKNGRTRTAATTLTRHNVTGAGQTENVQLISTNIAGDALLIGSIGDAGFAQFQNLGPVADAFTNSTPTNVIQIGRYDVNTNFLAFIDLNTNQASMAWLSTNAVRARATGTNSVRLGYMITDK